MANRRLLFLIILPLILIPIPERKTEITFLDVGQGDGIFVGIPGNEGEKILIDSGSSSSQSVGEYVLIPFLKSKGINHLDMIFVTHADSDHVSGIYELLEDEDFTVDSIYIPKPAERDEKYERLRAYDNVRLISKGDEIRTEKGKITCISPEPDRFYTDTNNQSLILLYKEERFSALFTGDADSETELRCLNDAKRLIKGLRLSVLKCGHHGSSTSLSEELLAQLSPMYAILSYGENNRYGHPHVETVEALQNSNAGIFRTAEDGAITVLTNGKMIGTETFVR